MFKRIFAGKRSDNSPLRTVDALEIEGVGCVLVVSDKFENAIGNVLSTSQTSILLNGVYVKEEIDSEGNVVRYVLKKLDNYIAE